MKALTIDEMKELKENNGYERTYITRDERGCRWIIRDWYRDSSGYPAGFYEHYLNDESLLFNRLELRPTAGFPDYSELLGFTRSDCGAEQTVSSNDRDA